MITGTPRMQLLIARDLRDDGRSSRRAPRSLPSEPALAAPRAAADASPRPRWWRLAILHPRLRHA
jgi:hypothetical protein